MRKLIKSKKDVSREHLRSLTLPPSRSESGEGFLQLPPQDSQDSSSVGSNSLEDGHPLGAKKSSTLKRLPFMRNRPKDKDKMKALYRRSVSMNDLVQSMVLAGGQWTGSAENLEGPDEIPTGKRRKDLGTMAFSTTAINFSTANQSGSFRTKQIIKSKDGASYEDISGQGVHDDSYMTTAGLAPRPASLDSGRTSYSNSNNNASLHEVTAPVTSQSRSQSHSSGDFNQHHDNEVWSNSSSPVQYYGYRLKKSAASSPMLRLKSCDGMESLAHSKKRLGSPGSEMVSLKQFLQESNKLTVSQIRSGSQEDLLDEVIRSLSSSSELAGLHSPSQMSPALSLGDRKTAKQEQIVQPSSSRAENNTRFPFPTVINASDGDSTTGQGTVCQLQQTKDAKQYATLPRASSVISTAEGTTRRTSIHDFLSKDNRSPVSVDPSPTKEDAPSLLSEYRAVKQCSTTSTHRPPPRLVGDGPHCCSGCDLVHYSRNTDNTVSLCYTSPCMPFPYLSLNPDLVSSISGPPGDRTIAFSTERPDCNETKKLNVNGALSRCDHSSQSLERNDAETSSLVSEDNQSIWYEYGCV